MHKDLKYCVEIYLGIKRGSDPTNICTYDPFYLESICKKFGKEEVSKEIYKQQKER